MSDKVETFDIPFDPPPAEETPKQRKARRLANSETLMNTHKAWCHRYGIPGFSREVVKQMLDIEPVTLKGGLVPPREGEEP